MKSGETLVLGATGLAGAAFCRLLGARGLEYATAARSDADFEVDLTKMEAVQGLLDECQPSVVINCAAMVDFESCRTDPSAWQINAMLPARVARWTKLHDARFMHISTDHFFVGDKDLAHDEDCPVAIVNDYAAQKYAGECLARTNPGALILRTAITGKRNRDKPTLAEWAWETIERGEPATLYVDAYTSLIDVDTFAELALDLLQDGASGVYNVASSEVFSKAQFVQALAASMGRDSSFATLASVRDVAGDRADSLGLDVGKAAKRLDRSFPTLEEVVENLKNQMEHA